MTFLYLALPSLPLPYIAFHCVTLRVGQSDYYTSKRSHLATWGWSSCCLPGRFADQEGILFKSPESLGCHDAMLWSGWIHFWGLSLWGISRKFMAYLPIHGIIYLIIYRVIHIYIHTYMHAFIDA